MDSIPVRMWRDHALLNLSQSWKAEIDKTIQDLQLWQDILDGNYYFKDGKKIKKSPAIKTLLDEYDRRSFDRDEIQQKRSGVHCEKSVSERVSEGRMQEPELPSLLARQTGWK